MEGGVAGWSALTSSLGGRGAGELRGGACARASSAAAASDEEWRRRRSSGLRRGGKGKKIRQRGEWRSLRHVRPSGKTRVGRPVSSISVKSTLFRRTRVLVRFYFVLPLGSRAVFFRWS